MTRENGKMEEQTERKKEKKSRKENKTEVREEKLNRYVDRPGCADPRIAW